ncbi:MAG: hypothetical protein QOE05_2486 [Actinomycetota bacterium]|jgi:hypothetical protein|nr:hypothetical protein [Actinomycetota bacterium]
MSLDRLLGHWNVTMQHVAVAEPVAIRQQFEKVLADAFVMFRSTCEHPDFPDAIALIEETKYHYFDVRGITRVFDIQIDDASWSMIRRDPDFWQRSTVRFVGPDAMEGTGENSHDGGTTWEHDYTISYARADAETP